MANICRLSSITCFARHSHILPLAASSSRKVHFGLRKESIDSSLVSVSHSYSTWRIHHTNFPMTILYKAHQYQSVKIGDSLISSPTPWGSERLERYQKVSWFRGERHLAWFDRCISNDPRWDNSWTSLSINVEDLLVNDIVHSSSKADQTMMEDVFEEILPEEWFLFRIYHIFLWRSSSLTD